MVALAAGFYLQNFAPVEGERLRRELKRASLPVFVRSSPWRGRIAAWPAGGAVAVDPAAGRSPARRPALRSAMGRPASSVTPVLARHGWLGLISQAGMVLALAQQAGGPSRNGGSPLRPDRAMIGVHEVVGPICFRTALVRAGESHGGEPQCRSACG